MNVSNIPWLLREYSRLFKIRIASFLVCIAVATAILAGEASTGRLLTLLLAVFLASAGTGPVNHFVDRDIDALMQRTQSRPLVLGTVSSPNSVLIGLSSIFLGLAISAIYLGLLTTAFIALGAFTYLVIYSLLLKRRTQLNVVIGGAAGSFAVLAGWASASTSPMFLPFMFAALVFLWTPSHFWCFSLAHFRDYSNAKLPMLPVVQGKRKTSIYILLHTLALIVLSIAIYFEASFSSSYLIVIIPVGVFYLYQNLRLIFQPEESAAWKSYRFSGIYLGSIFSGALFDKLTQTQEWGSFLAFIIKVLSAPYAG